MLEVWGILNPIVEVDLDQEVLNVCEDWSDIPDQGKRFRIFETLKKLEIDFVAPMHGPCLKREHDERKFPS